MVRDSLQRCYQLLLTLLLCTPFTFILARKNIPVIPSALDKIKAYLYYLKGLLEGNLNSFSPTSQTIKAQIMAVLPATLEISCCAFIVVLLIGIPLGILAGSLPGRWIDRCLLLVTRIGSSAPLFWVSLLAIFLFSFDLQWFPSSGRYTLHYEVQSITGFMLIDIGLTPSPHRQEMLANVLCHLALPVIVVAIQPTSQFIQLLRLQTMTVYKQNYVKFALARGLSPITLIFRHVLRNTLIPLLPQLGSEFAVLFIQTLTIEKVFNWPGLGHFLLQSMCTIPREYGVLSAIILVCGVLIIVAYLLFEGLHILMNPQLKGTTDVIHR